VFDVEAEPSPRPSPVSTRERELNVQHPTSNTQGPTMRNRSAEADPTRLKELARPTEERNMVQAAWIKRIQHQLNVLNEMSFTVGEYSGEDRNAAFDLTSEETFLSGVAETILSGQAVDQRFLPPLTRTGLIGNVWHAMDGCRYTFNPESTLVAFARQLECLRRHCRASVE
jgi:hypothetical protein